MVQKGINRLITMNKRFIKVAQQDDCAPDSLEYFEKDFERIVGQSFGEWKEEAECCTDGYSHIFIKGQFRVKCDAGDPYWILEQEVK